MEYFAQLASILTLFLVALFYIIDFLKLRTKIRNYKKKINIELRTLYFNSILPNIKSYDQLRNSEYKIEINNLKWLTYDASNVRNLLNSDLNFKILKNNEELRANFEIIVKVIDLMIEHEKSFQNALRTVENIKIKYDTMFGRLKELRDRILELHEMNSFIDLNIMSLEKIGSTKHSKPFILKKYKDMQILDGDIYEIVKKYNPGVSIRKLSEQNFG